MKNLSYLFLFLSLIAEIIGTIGGFGSSVFFVPVANFYFGFESVLGLTAIYHLSSNVSKIVLFKQGLNKKLLINIGVPSVLFVIVGGLLTKALNSGYLELSLGIFLVLLALIFLVKRNLIINPNRRNAIIGGSLSGFSAGLLGTGGAIRGLTMAAFNLEKSVFIATSAFIDFFIDFSRTFVYYFNGYIHKHDLIYVPFLLIIGFVGTAIGKKILAYIPQDKFKRISLTLILLIGLLTVLNTVIKQKEWVIKRDRLQRIKFATLKSPFADQLAQQYGLQTTDHESIRYLSNGKLHLKSDAVLALANDLGGLYRIAYLGRYIPVKWRDALYDLVAKNRYRLLGKTNSCMLPTPALRKRLLT